MFLAMAVLAAFAVGCQGRVRGPQVFAGVNNNPNCAPGPKPCPREYPEFPLPPGGPYLTTPPHGQAGPGPARLDLNAGNQELSVKQQK